MQNCFFGLLVIVGFCHRVVFQACFKTCQKFIPVSMDFHASYCINNLLCQNAIVSSVLL